MPGQSFEIIEFHLLRWHRTEGVCKGEAVTAEAPEQRLGEEKS